MHDIKLIPKREILWNVAGPINVAIFYAIFILSLFVCCYGFYRRYLLWNSGRSDKSRRGNFLERAKILFSAIALQKTVNRDKEVKYFHAPIFYGFLVLLFTTTMVFIDQDLGIKIYQGDFYLLVTVFSDLF